MAIGGYKRIALAALIAQKRSIEEDNTQRPEKQNLNRTYPIPDSDREGATSIQAVPATSKRFSFKALPQEEQERLKKSEKWNAKKQELENAEKKRVRKQEKERRSKARRKQLKAETRAKLMHTKERLDQTQDADVTLSLPEVKHLNSSSWAISSEQHEEHGIHAISEQIGLEQYGTELLGDVLLDFGSKDDGQQTRHVRESTIEETSALQKLQNKSHRSDTDRYQPRTPTCSPTIRGPITPTQPTKSPVVLLITPRRHPSPQLEYIISPGSPILLKNAASMLNTLKARTAHLNIQITSFTTHLVKVQNVQAPTSKTKPDDQAARAKVLKKIVATMEKHSNEVLMMEYALRDVIDEGDGDLPETLRSTEADFTALVKVYESKIRNYMGRLSPEAVEKTLVEM